MSNISWQAPEFKEQKKSQTWFIIFGIICLLLVAYAVYQKSLISIVTFILLSITSLVFALKKPANLNHEVTSTGIIVGEVVYPYKIIKSFWIVYDPPQVKTLNFETIAYLNRFVSLQLEQQDPIALKKELKKYLEEDLEREESLSDAMARKLKF